jgi:hypothetical protein
MWCGRFVPMNFDGIFTKIALLTEILHVCYELPGPRDLAGFKDVGIELSHGRPAIDNNTSSILAMAHHRSSSRSLRDHSM